MGWVVSSWTFFCLDILLVTGEVIGSKENLPGPAGLGVRGSGGLGSPCLWAVYSSLFPPGWGFQYLQNSHVKGHGSEY